MDLLIHNRGGGVIIIINGSDYIGNVLFCICIAFFYIFDTILIFKLIFHIIFLINHVVHLNNTVY